jgi:hypothetical protein
LDDIGDMDMGDLLMFETRFVSSLAVATGLAVCSLSTEALAAPAAKSSPSMTLAECYDVEGPKRTGERLGGALTPAGAVSLYWATRYGKDISVLDAKVTVLSGPEYGTLAEGGRGMGGPGFSYSPIAGYLGKDKITFLVEVAGKRIKVLTTMYVVEQTDGNGSPPCGYEVKRIGAADTAIVWPIPTLPSSA